MIRLLIINTVLCFSIICDAQKTYPLRYLPIKINESCEGQAVRKKIFIDLLELQESKITFIGSNNPSMKLLFKGKEVTIDQAIVLKEAGDYSSLYIQFFIKEDLSNPQLYIKQEIEALQRTDTIDILKAQYFLNYENKFLRVSDACQDSITLNFPFGGTQTDIKFFKYIDGDYQEILNRTYYCCGYGNTIKLPREDNNKYKFGYTACYTSYSEFEFETR